MLTKRNFGIASLVGHHVPALKTGFACRRDRRILCLVTVFLVVGAGGRPANAMEGFYVGAAIGQEYVGADYTKSVAIPRDNIGGTGVGDRGSVRNSYREAGDDETEGVPAFKFYLGHRWNLPGRFYVSGEIEGTVYSDARVTGFLEGTGTGTLDVWPGNWAFEKHHSIGLSAKVGYRPESFAFLGEGRSAYVFSGVQYLDVAIEGGFDNRSPTGGDLDSLCPGGNSPCDLQAATGTRHGDRTAVPWLIGGGIEVGSREHRMDLRIHYALYEVDFNLPDPSQGVFVNHQVAIDELGIYLGYVRSFAFSSLLDF